MARKVSAKEVDAYLEGLEDPKRLTLQRLRASILRLVPDADQGLSYGVPAFRVNGKVVAGFSAAKAHLSYLPHSGAILPAMSPEELEGLSASKGALRFPVDNPPSDALIAKLIAARQAQISQASR